MQQQHAGVWHNQLAGLAVLCLPSPQAHVATIDLVLAYVRHAHPKHLSTVVFSRLPAIYPRTHTRRAYAAMPQLFPGDVEQQNYLRFLIQAAAIKAAAATAAAAGGADPGMAQQCGELRAHALPQPPAQAQCLHPSPVARRLFDADVSVPRYCCYCRYYCRF
jgi:hypothetical protein